MKDTQWLCVPHHTALYPSLTALGGLLGLAQSQPGQTHAARPSHPKHLCLWSHGPPISISASHSHRQLRASSQPAHTRRVSLQSLVVCVGGGRCHHYFCFLYTALEIYCILR